MSSLAEITDIKATEVLIEQDMFYVVLEDGRRIGVPYSWFWRLEDASHEQRKKWRFISGGYGIHWEEIDEDISIAGIIKGNRGPKRPKPGHQKRA
jgi:hypothetical protein